jgi:hypothetical protein
MWDLRTYPNAPSAMHAFINCSSEWTVRNTILADGADSRSRWAASIPLKTGMVMSATITSGPPRVMWRHRLRFPLRQTDASEAQLWLQAGPDGHPPIALAVGSKFASFRAEGYPLSSRRTPRVQLQSSELFLGQHATSWYWGNP